MNRRIVLGGALAAVALAAGGAGVALASSGGSGSSGGQGYSGYGARGVAPAPSSVTLMGTHTALGPTLADGQGRTVYLFASDSATRSTCYGSCASIWPPVPATSAPQTASGASDYRIGSIQRTGGGSQLTYQGHPLYYYAGDAKPGDTGGQALNQFGAKWYALTPSGITIDND